MFFFLPYRIDRFFRTPWMTISLIAANVVMFVLSVALGLDWTVQSLGFRMNALGAVTWFTSMFLHTDILHIAGNMYFLWLFGSVVEDALGRWRMLGVYVAGGLAASLAHGLMVLAFMPAMREIPAAGASGALAAIMGLYAVRFYKTKIKVWYFFWIFLIFRAGSFAITSLAGIVLWFARDLFDGLAQIAVGGGGVANWAHLGGAIFGAAVGYFSGQVRSASHEYLAEDARQYAQSGRADVAAAKYAELAADDPRNPDWHRLQARQLVEGRSPDTELTKNEYAQAVALFASAHRVPDAFDTYVEAEAAVGPLPVDHRIVLALGAEAERRQDWGTAERLYRLVIEEQSGSPGAEKALFRLAHVYLGANHRDVAMQTWRAFRERHPLSEWSAFADPAFRTLGP